MYGFVLFGKTMTTHLAVKLLVLIMVYEISMFPLVFLCVYDFFLIKCSTVFGGVRIDCSSDFYAVFCECILCILFVYW